MAPQHLHSSSESAIDLELLLGEVRELLRGMSQLTSAQAAELVRLGAASPAFGHATEDYTRRSQGALKDLDVALVQLRRDEDDESEADEDDFIYDSPVYAWLQGVANQLHEHEPEDQQHHDEGNMLPEPSDFWTALDEIRWDDEPETASPVSSSGLSLPELSSDIDSDEALEDQSDDLSPWDSVSARNEPRSPSGYAHNGLHAAQKPRSSFRARQPNDDSTLYHAEPLVDDDEDGDDELARALQRHAFLTGVTFDALPLALKRASVPRAEQSKPLATSAPRFAPSLVQQPAPLAAF